MKLKDSKTYVNLAKSYAGECQARTRYEFIVYGARMNGYKYLAELVEKVVYNEFNHARMFYTFIQQSEEKQVENIDIASGYPFKEKWDLQANLRIAAEDEMDEATRIYPNTPRRRARKASRRSQNSTRTSSRWKPAIRNSSPSSTSR